MQELLFDLAGSTDAHPRRGTDLTAIMQPSHHFPPSVWLLVTRTRELKKAPCLSQAGFSVRTCFCVFVCVQGT